MQKKKEPKLAAAESDHEVYELLADIQSQFHEELNDANIGVVWLLEPKTSKGKQVYGTCRIVPEMWHRLCGLDIVIEVDHTFWQHADDEARSYLLDHELSHATVKLGEEGEPQEDRTGRVLYTSVPHDVEEFAGPVRRWGMKNSDLVRFVADTEGQLSLAFHEEEAEAGIIRAAQRFKDGIPKDHTVTLEVEGHEPVTMTGG